jgi:hypothetical protein
MRFDRCVISTQLSTFEAIALMRAVFRGPSIPLPAIAFSWNEEHSPKPDRIRLICVRFYGPKAGSPVGTVVSGIASLDLGTGRTNLNAGVVEPVFAMAGFVNCSKKPFTAYMRGLRKVIATKDPSVTLTPAQNN